MYKSGTMTLSFTVEAGKKYFIAADLFALDFSAMNDPKWNFSVSDSSGKNVSQFFNKTENKEIRNRANRNRKIKISADTDPALLKALERQKERKAKQK